MTVALMSAFITSLGDPAAANADEVGPKAANLALLGRAGLPTPGGFALTAAAYRHQLRHLGIEDEARAYDSADFAARCKLSVQMRLALYQGSVAPAILAPLVDAWRAQRAAAPLGAVRSSALIEDRESTSFAGQFESFLGLSDENELLIAVRACWAALWTSRARRYMEPHGLSPADSAMAVLIQPLIQAHAAGGGLSQTADGQMLITATWGLGSALAQGEVVPDRIALDRIGRVLSIDAGRKPQRDQCVHGLGLGPRPVPLTLACDASIGVEQAEALGAMLLKAEKVCGGPRRD
jgi:phosphoenolpyruvate synthase/pyruvate phosphate dikinase